MRAPKSPWLDFLGGWAAAQVFLATLILSDSNGIAGLLTRAGDPLLPVAMLSVVLGGVVGIAALATGLAGGGQPSLPKKLRMSATRRSGASIAAKWPPLGISVQWTILLPRSAKLLTERKSHGNTATPVGVAFQSSR